MKKLIQLFALVLILSSCARSYHAINPAIYNFENIKKMTDDVTVSYIYDAHTLVKNTPYARKERRV